MTEKQTLPPQHQDHRPGTEAQMHPQPVYISDDYRALRVGALRVALRGRSE